MACDGMRIQNVSFKSLLDDKHPNVYMTFIHFVALWIQAAAKVTGKVAAVVGKDGNWRVSHWRNITWICGMRSRLTLSVTHT